MLRQSVFAVLLSAALGLAAPRAAGAESLVVEPGQWEIRTEIANSLLQVPRVVTKTECVTDGEWSAERLMRDAKGCKLSDVVSSASRLEWNVVCTGPGGRMTGTAAYESWGDHVEGTMNTSMESETVSLTMDMKFDGRRIGECEPE